MREQKKTGGRVVDSDEVTEANNRLVGIMGEVCVEGLKGRFESDLPLELQPTISNYFLIV